MSLSGYDSEAVGFDPVNLNKEIDRESSTQTSEFSSTGIGTQTTTMKDCGINTSKEDLHEIDNNSKEINFPGLNDFLKRVVPAVLEQLNLNENESHFDSSESDEEEVVIAKLFQEINVTKEGSITDIKASGDNPYDVILDLSLSSTGNTLAVSTGKINHEEWCEHDGIIKIFNTKPAEDHQFVHAFNIKEKSCVSVLKFHPSMALLAYGTVSGDVGVCNMRNINEDGIQIKAPSDSHETKRISSLYWSDSALANAMLTLKLTGKRRGASDQVLISSGSDGSINVWQVNINLNTFENIIRYQINGTNKTKAEDITCFDFAKRVNEDQSDDVFVVGTKNGGLLVCKTKTYQQIVGSTAVDPVYNALNTHATCVIKVCFNGDKKRIFASVSIDSEFKIYDFTQKSPLKVIIIEQEPSCFEWLFGPSILVGLAKIKKQDAMVKLLNVETGNIIPFEGFLNKHDNNDVCVTAIEIKSSSIYRVFLGTNYGKVLLWELPVKRTRFLGTDFK